MTSKAQVSVTTLPLCALFSYSAQAISSVGRECTLLMHNDVREMDWTASVRVVRKSHRRATNQTKLPSSTVITYHFSYISHALLHCIY
jgi:hypothetical protein